MKIIIIIDCRVMGVKSDSDLVIVMIVVLLVKRVMMTMMIVMYT